MGRDRSGDHEGDDGDVSGSLTLSRSEFWQGPLPPPAVLQQFEDIYPGLANRIVHIAEADTVERAKVYRNESDAYIALNKRGQLFAALLSVVAMGLAAWMFVSDRPYAGAAFLAVPLIGLIREFLSQYRSGGAGDGTDDPGRHRSE